ncbi:class I SAM-dependent methyltransferase [Stutzerimonas nosocomialis]|uniref:class I SAM-dependent methyltransferase n=1 Tax=Stutzerimonas nosocomialis TaxID=1056496 RepID=UPI0011096242|nr:class I SAM-dependent methyltransferase [Stutzerimonas nosocomialis]TLX56596.1 class I SAM-dependent methyltransferase [Stutzerimonas nosocomialis]TLX58236.1 class I SAM-dependent methyltransferase [Stutzerimonas nosocomialis]
MNAKLPSFCLAPAAQNPSSRKILLIGSHQPALLRCLDGWPRHRGKPRALLIQFNADTRSLADYPTDAFDLAVVQAPAAEALDHCIRELTRVARQGLITRR